MNKKLQSVFFTPLFCLFHQQHSNLDIVCTATIGDLDDISHKTCLQLKVVVLKTSCFLENSVKQNKNSHSDFFCV